MVFFGFVFFEVLAVIVVCFWCVWHSSRSVKNACFFSQFFGAFVGWFILAYFGFGRFSWCWFLCLLLFLLFFVFFLYFVLVLLSVFVVFCFFVLFLLEG